MRFTFLIIFACLSLRAQVAVDYDRVPDAFKSLQASAGEKKLQCEIFPFKPRVDFGFRFQTGYGIALPLHQFRGPGHALGILTKVTPEGGGKPVHLVSGVRLPEVPETKVKVELGGSFLTGEGRYKVEVFMIDDATRVCRKTWTITAKRSRAERNMSIRLPDGAVRSLSARHAATVERSGDRPYRVTVLVHAAPVFPFATRLRFFDRELLVGTLGPLLEQLPAQSVRLVLFNLSQQKRLLDRDPFRPEELDQVSQALNGLELGTVHITTLQNTGGHLMMLADLINHELEAKERPDAVIFLGPVTRYWDKLPPSVLAERSSGDPLFFYLQYHIFMQRGNELPDLIQNTVKSLRGKTLTVHNPGEFANALKQIESRMQERQAVSATSTPN